MQPTIHQRKSRIFIASMSGFTFQCIVGCIFYSAGLIITLYIFLKSTLGANVMLVASQISLGSLLVNHPVYNVNYFFSPHCFFCLTISFLFMK
jgi:hypothetical protein